MVEEGIKNELYTEGKITDVDIEPMMKNSFLDYSINARLGIYIRVNQKIVKV